MADTKHTGACIAKQSAAIVITLQTPPITGHGTIMQHAPVHRTVRSQAICLSGLAAGAGQAPKVLDTSADDLAERQAGMHKSRAPGAI